MSRIDILCKAYIGNKKPWLKHFYDSDDKLLIDDVDNDKQYECSMREIIDLLKSG